MTSNLTIKITLGGFPFREYTQFIHSQLLSELHRQIEQDEGISIEFQEFSKKQKHVVVLSKSSSFVEIMAADESKE